MGYSGAHLPGYFLGQNKERPKGVEVEVYDGESQIPFDDLLALNNEFNAQSIYIDNFDISLIGGKGGPGLDSSQIVPMINQILNIYIGPIILGIASNFAYDKFKMAIDSTIKKSRSTKGKHIIHLHHGNNTVIYVYDPENSEEGVIDIYLDALFSDVTLIEDVGKLDPVAEARMRKLGSG